MCQNLTHFEVGSAYCVCNGSGINARLGERFKGHQKKKVVNPPTKVPSRRVTGKTSVGEDL